MIKASLIASYYKNNEIFNISDETKNRDGCLYPFYMLRESLLNHGIELATSDINKPSDSSISISFDFSDEDLNAKVKYLVIFESEIIVKNNWDITYHAKFDKIFTWNDKFIDNERYFKINFPNFIPTLEMLNNNNTFSKRKLCAVISGNKIVDHELELYSERLKAIKWFEVNHPEDFDLYGVGWDEFRSGNRYVNAMVRKLGLNKALNLNKRSSYRGKIVSKLETLNNYKFSICYENGRDIPGYITEKIFDCFFAGCVPIYWGASNIDKHIPKNCYIDKRDFSTYEELYAFINSMTSSQFQKYVDNIYAFLNSEKAGKFSDNKFVATLVEHVIKDIF